MSDVSPFFRDPKIVWIGPYDPDQPLRFFALMEEEYPTERVPNAIFRVEGTVSVTERRDPQRVRHHAMHALLTLCLRYKEFHKESWPK